MHVTVGLLVLFVLGTSWVCDARELMTTGLPNREITTSDFSVLQINHQESEGEVKLSGEVRNANFCTLCEEFTSEAINYLDKNKTQTQIVNALQKTCSLLGSFKQQCIALVDYYVPLLFLEIESVQPAEFCQKIYLCEKMSTLSQPPSENKCEICRHAVSEFLLKLKDPETELDIIEFLMKACDAVEIHVKRCKAMVIEYGPVILANVEQLLEKADICTAIHACDLPSVDSNQEETPLLSVL